ncbi:TIGR01440 family protein [Limosilactobacillus kribbianus]|uniref:TIGR01440 family protein n=1 Tax=Limosilactobacillus kribbianus TaxID=2982695 RepID=UPI002263D4AB|nr:TIGR01440 family protein [Limosilactobacillus kribbianus]
MVDLAQIKQQTKQGLTELLDQAKLKKGDLFVLGLSTSEVQGGTIGEDYSIEVGRAIVKTIINELKPLGIHLAVQGCQHLNRALVVERAVAEQYGLEQVLVYPQIHAGGAGQIAAFENFEDPIEVEQIQAHAGMDIGDTFIGMQVRFVQVPVRNSIDTIGQAHTTYLRSRPKYIGGPRAKYSWDPFDQQH